MHRLQRYGQSSLSLLSTYSSFTEVFPLRPIQVVDAYKQDGFAMLLRAFNEDKFLEQLTGLDRLYEEGEAALEQVDWDESDAESGASI